MTPPADTRGSGRLRTLSLLLAVAAIFFCGIIVRRLLWP